MLQASELQRLVLVWSRALCRSEPLQSVFYLNADFVWHNQKSKAILEVRYSPCSKQRLPHCDPTCKNVPEKWIVCSVTFQDGPSKAIGFLILHKILYFVRFFFLPPKPHFWAHRFQPYKETDAVFKLLLLTAHGSFQWGLMQTWRPARTERMAALLSLGRRMLN